MIPREIEDFGREVSKVENATYLFPPMSSVVVKSDDSNSRSPTSTEQSHTPYLGDGDDSPDNELSPEVVIANSRKESHRASERVGLEQYT